MSLCAKLLVATISLTLPRLGAADPGGRREIHVVEHRLYPKRGRLEIGALFGAIMNDAFHHYMPIGGRVGYHFWERLAVEMQASYLLAFSTQLRGFLHSQDADLDARSRDQQQLRAELAALWSPVYGKLSAFERIWHFDGFTMLGGGFLRTKVDPDRPSLTRAAVRPEGILGLGMRLFLSNRWSVRLEYRQYFYSRPESSDDVAGGLALPSEISLGVSALLGG